MQSIKVDRGYYYIDYDEWVDGQRVGLVNAIINITKEKD